MKLKKIASLALAGVMAVSMLAGCAGKTGTTDDGTKVEVASSIVTALNNGQSADNKAKVTFSSDATFDALAQKAVAMQGDVKANTNNATAIVNDIVSLTGEYGKFNGTVFVANTDSAFTVNGADPVSVLYVLPYDAAYWTESDVAANAAREADAKIAKLVADTKEGTAQGKTYYTYTYTGKASLVSVSHADGTTGYYVVAAVTRTATEGTVPTV